MVYNFYDELKDNINSKVLINPTIDYHIRGFISAMNMHVTKGNIDSIPLDKDFIKNNMPFIKNIEKANFVTKKGNDYNITFSVMEAEKVNIVSIYGEYMKEKFEFVNYFGKHISKRIVREIPFDLRLTKVHGNREYHMDVITNDNKMEFTFYYRDLVDEDYYGKMSFMTHPVCIYDVFEIIYEFNNVPQKLFEKCNEIIECREIMLNKKEYSFLKKQYPIYNPKGKILKKV